MSNFNQTTYDQRRTSRWPLPQDYDDEQVFNKRVDTSRPTTGHEVQRIDSATMPPMGEFKFGPQSPVSESRFDNSPTDARFAPDAKDVAYRRDERATTQVVGTTNLYEHGELRLIPMPTPDPKDPLNLPNWRKWVAIGTLCFFGSLALSAEIVIGGILPIFILEYAGLDPRIINNAKIPSGHGINLNPLAVLPPGVPPPPLGKIVLIATIPFLSNGVASYFLVPLSIAFGRRPVLLVAALTAVAGGLWAGLSNSLDQHIAARVLGGLGAGAVEALIPLIVQDMVFIHQRNKAMSAIISSQGLIIIGLGIASPYVAANYTWRWLYYITSGFGFIAWLLLVAFLPETRWTRSKEELAGQRLWPLRPGQDRPDLDPETYGSRTLWTNIGILQFGTEWKHAGRSMLNTLRTTFFPTVIWCVLTNTVFIVANQGVQQIAAFALVAQGWEFQYTGLSVIPFFAASIMVYAFAGPIADWTSNALTRWNGGHREPEHHLVNLIFPFVAGVAGCFVFGYAGQNNLHWAILLTGSFLIIFGFLTIMSLFNVFIVESYPMWAGPVLVNVSSLRLVISFFLSSQATLWIQQMGMMQTFTIYAEAMIVLSLGIPLLYFFGKKLRQKTAGKVHGVREEKRAVAGSETGSGKY